MTRKIEETSRVQTAGFLPDAIARALTSYQKFSESASGVESKDFAAHHNACKIAIAHIELLLKLARWADLPGDDAPSNDKAILSAMMSAAEEELERYHSGENLFP